MKRNFIVTSMVALVVLAVAGAGMAGDSHEAALGGYCPVAYVAMNKAIKGAPAISVEHEGHHILLANEKAKAMFEADPEKYRVAYDGWCATAMAMGKELASDPTVFTRVDGVTYLFSSEDAKKMFETDSHGTIDKAAAQWAALNPAFGGYCPVAYVAKGMAVKGDPEVTLNYEGHLYQFAMPMAKEMFEKNPAKYHVAYDGWCATAISMGKKIKSDPALFTVLDGTTYLFSSDEAKKMFDHGPEQHVSKGDKQWASLN